MLLFKAFIKPCVEKPMLLHFFANLIIGKAIMCHPYNNKRNQIVKINTTLIITYIFCNKEMNIGQGGKKSL